MCALEDRFLLKGVSFLLLDNAPDHDDDSDDDDDDDDDDEDRAPLAKGLIKDSLTEVESTFHLDLFTTSEKCRLLPPWNIGLQVVSTFNFQCHLQRDCLKLHSPGHCKRGLQSLQ